MLARRPSRRTWSGRTSGRRRPCWSGCCTRIAASTGAHATFIAWRRCDVFDTWFMLSPACRACISSATRILQAQCARLVSGGLRPLPRGTHPSALSNLIGSSEQPHAHGRCRGGCGCLGKCSFRRWCGSYRASRSRRQRLGHHPLPNHSAVRPLAAPSCGYPRGAPCSRRCIGCAAAAGRSLS